jgi:E3 ubiquitin-protein ligase RAD18
MQPNTLAALLNTDIPDPTDFHSPFLRQLDSALRCSICSECFDAPVTLNCGHCFCSLVSSLLCWSSCMKGHGFDYRWEQCARSYINEKSECPSCRKIANEGHLRVNPAMEEVVSAWKLARCVTPLSFYLITKSILPLHTRCSYVHVQTPRPTTVQRRRVPSLTHTNKQETET